MSRQRLQQRTQVTLAELLASRPLQQGLAELVAYLQPGSGASARRVIDDSVQEHAGGMALARRPGRTRARACRA